MEKPLMIIVMSTLTPLFVHLLSGINYYWDYAGGIWNKDPTAEIYDFIVVGSGSSGSVVAYRLSAQNYKVLLVEAGGEPIALSKIPAMSLDLLNYRHHDWMYKNNKQENVGLSLKKQVFQLSRGKVLGGTSTLNSMLYLRGHPFDYDNWANLTGDSSWNYTNVLPFFKKSIYEYRGHFQKNKKHYESSPYGFLTVEKLRWGKMLDNFNEAGAELGYNGGIDANGPQAEGVGRVEVTQRDGERVSAYDAILRHRHTLPRLTITKYSQATKILIDKNKNAIGVEYYRHGNKYTAKASKEIIVSAGAIDSPKLLMLSGIGQKKFLTSVGITTKVNLPVGKNLQDHFSAFLLPFVTKPGSSFLFERDVGLSSVLEYFQEKTGIFTASTGINAQFFCSTPGNVWPNIQTFFSPVAPSKMMGESFENALDFEKDVFSNFVNPVHGKDGFIFITFLTRPKSRGGVALFDKNPFTDPKIDLNQFSHSDDIKNLIYGIRETLKLVSTKSFQRLEAKHVPIKLSKCNSHTFDSNEYWECYIRHTSIPSMHPAGSCKMSHKDDPSAVVDPQLRVLETRNLRVADASIMPFIVNANPSAPCMMIGEKAADVILDYWAAHSLVCNRLQPMFQENKCYYSERNFA